MQHVCEIISSKIRDYIDPLPEVEMIPHVIDGLHILQLKVNAGHYTPYYYVGDGQRVAFKEERKPVFKSTATQFMTIIYSMEYEPTDQQGEQHGTKLGLSWDQVGTKLGLSWDEVEKLFIALQEPKSMGELKDLYGWSNTTKFKAKYVSPLIEKKIVGMTLPDKPTSPKQKYFLTDSGKALLVNVTRNPNAGEEEKLNHLIGNLSEEEKRLALELLQKVQ